MHPSRKLIPVIPGSWWLCTCWALWSMQGRGGQFWRRADQHEKKQSRNVDRTSSEGLCIPWGGLEGQLGQCQPSRARPLPAGGQHKCGEAFHSRGSHRSAENSGNLSATNTHLFGIWIHSVSRPYECGKFFSQSSVVIHQAGAGPHLCGKCGKSFSLSSFLNNHQSPHWSKRPCECGQCGRPCECGQCGRPFRQSPGLMQPWGVHTWGKLCKCREWGESCTAELTSLVARLHSLFSVSLSLSSCITWTEPQVSENIQEERPHKF